MKELKNTWYNRLIFRFFLNKELKKYSDSKVKALYLELLDVKKRNLPCKYPNWSIDIMLKKVIKRLDK